jgi:hypothetical protein
MRKRAVTKVRRTKARNHINGRHKVRQPKKRARASDPLFSNKEVFYDSGPSDVAQNHDKYLTEMLVEEHERGQRRRYSSITVLLLRDSGRRTTGTRWLSMVGSSLRDRRSLATEAILWLQSRSI